jgi:gelsolin
LPVNFADEFGNGNDYAEFFTALGSGSSSDVADAPDNDDDLIFEKHQQVTCKSLCSIESLFNKLKLFQSVVTLYRVSDATGQLTVEEVGTKPLQQSMLKKEVILTQFHGFY